MTEIRSKDEISLSGRVFDPLEEHARQNSNEPGRESSRRPEWVVQFFDALDAPTIAEFHNVFGLELTEFTPPSSYVESLTSAAAEALRTDPRVRAVTLMSGEIKLSADLRALMESDDEDDPAPVDIVLSDATADLALAQIRELVPASDIVAELDDRARGGKLVVRLNIKSHMAARVAEIDGVRWIQQVPEIKEDSRPAVVQPTSPARIAVADRLGLDGSGQIIGVIDNGPPDLAHCFFTDRTGAAPGTSHRKVLAVRNAQNTPAGKHATFTCGIAAGDSADEPGTLPHRGVASAAKLVCGNQRDLKVSSSLIAELDAAAALGAFIHTNSWHSAPQGPSRPATYDQRSFDLDLFVWTNEDHMVAGSSGNAGEEQGPPGTAKNALCVSAVSGGNPSALGDGNPGPTADGRMKPDVTGIGCGWMSAALGTPCDTRTDERCASSYATPWLAGVLALVRQQLSEGRQLDGSPQVAAAFSPTGALLRAIAVSSAVSTSSSQIVPNPSHGWGKVDPDAALGQVTPRILLDVRNAVGTQKADVRRLFFTVEGSEQLTVTLTWSDPPASIGVDRTLVNNLDLRVTAPEGQIFLGNSIVEGISIAGGAPDSVNSTEVVVVRSAAAGLWTVEIVGTTVNRGNPGQGFAVVVTGSLQSGAEFSTDGSGTLRRTDPIPLR